MDSAGSQSCKPRSVPCPTTCAEGEHKCTETTAGTTYAFCIADDDKCPLQCSSSQHICEGADGVEFCSPITQACPVRCDASSEIKCTEPGDPPYSWCQNVNETCPLFCVGETQMQVSHVTSK